MILGNVVLYEQDKLANNMHECCLVAISKILKMCPKKLHYVDFKFWVFLLGHVEVKIREKNPKYLFRS